MKPTFRHSVKGFRGINRKEDLVYCSYKGGAVMIARTLPRREITEKNHDFGSTTKHLHELYASTSPEYKLDMSNYAKLHSTLPECSHKLAASASALFKGMMWRLKKKNPEIDLATITRDEILINEYPVRTVREAMETGMLLLIMEGNLLVHII